MRKFVGLMVGVLFTASVSFGQTNEYTSLVKDYLKAAGTEATFKLTVKEMIVQMRKVNKDIPSDFWDEAEKELLATSLDDLAGLLSPIYNKYFTSDDLKEIIRFYGSNVGKKLSGSTASISEESMAAGEAWGKKIGERISKKLDERGFKL